jgi:hypothetical protein
MAAKKDDLNQLRSWIRMEGRDHRDLDFYTFRSMMEEALKADIRWHRLNVGDNRAIQEYLNGFLAGKYPDHVFT